MSHHIHLLQKAYEEVGNHDGIDGAVAGAIAVAGSVATAAAVAGLALTPVGWVTMGALGALGGGTGLFKKLKKTLG